MWCVLGSNFKGTVEDFSGKVGDEGRFIFDLGDPDDDVAEDLPVSEKSAGWRVSKKRVSFEFDQPILEEEDGRGSEDESGLEDDNGSENESGVDYVTQ